MGSAGVVVLCVLAVWFTKGFSLPLGETSQTHDNEFSGTDPVEAVLNLESMLDHYANIQLALLATEGSGSLDTTPSSEFSTSSYVIQ